MNGQNLKIFTPTSIGDTAWLRDLWLSEWGGEGMVSRGHVYHLQDLQALVAVDATGGYVGAATYRIDPAGDIELMSLNATTRGVGIGSKLLAEVEAIAARSGAGRVWLITSNDNLDAIRFYQRRGYRMVAVHIGAVDEARRLKPTIPLVGEHGIDIHDEIELAKQVG
ncbi:GNAT family N-acetyltransferase [Alicyclobacillus acidiphilus]|uniref:GNAT family N-acetyltransferase n=1 Tax=Alicyclobacillus acidiphilus TaxID=182455 RepID=UPI000A6C54C3|nr:GNAT family N-acetyltransferase [Alicyclobacillus acidiphilus]